MAEPTRAPNFGISRRERILDELRITGAITTADLARKLGVTEMTVRRDITDLANRGLVTRVHGGATLRSSLDTTVARAATDAPRFRVGMVVPSLSYYWPQVVIGARATATEVGIQLVLRGANYAVADQRRQITSLVEAGGIHGLIVAPQNLGPDGHSLLEWLASLPVPIVLVERRVPSSLGLTNLEWVTTDHTFGGSLAAQHLAALGHRKLGIITSNSSTSWQLLRGWEQAMGELGLETTIDRLLRLDLLEGAEREDVVDSLLEEVRATGTTAMLIHSDPQALFIQQHALDRGWQMPNELSIVAYDDEVAENGSPPITALRPAKQHIGRRAVELMMARLVEGSRRPVERVQVLPALHIRESTARLGE